MNKKRIVKMTVVAAATIFATQGQAFEFGKPITTSVVITKPGFKEGVSSRKKEITVMNIRLNPREQNALFAYTPRKKNQMTFARGVLPPSVNLGMNNVPVLDQGYHGSCVTFAITGAIDAVLGKGDYVSQLCNLELGSYLEAKGYMPSGWWGSFGPWVLDQVMRFGVVNKHMQKTRTCAEVTEYPLRNFLDEGKPMPLGEFKHISEDLSEKLYPVYHMNFFQRFQTRFAETNEADRVLTRVKESLVRGNRLTIGTFIVLTPYCSAGACASYKAEDDTWALTKDLDNPPYATGGHEMIITGYDDNATALDSQGGRHQGLIKLRNSWGEEVGDQGDYYMTYDYFKKFVGEISEIVELK